MKAYKVVEICNDEFTSVFARDEYKKEYKIGEITKEADGTLGLFCFDNLDDAIDYYESISKNRKNRYFNILKVNGINKKEIPSEQISCQCDGNTMKKFYEFLNQECENPWGIRFPWKGTVCFESVKVIKIIK